MAVCLITDIQYTVHTKSGIVQMVKCSAWSYMLLWYFTASVGYVCSDVYEYEYKF